MNEKKESINKELNKIETTTNMEESGVEYAISMLKQFNEIKKSVLRPDDVVNINGKPCIKRSGWRIISVVFNVSTEIIYINKQFYDNNPDKLIVEVKARAIAQNGRYEEEIGSCDWREFNNGKLKGKGTTHNITTKAVTRAINRAISNLVGGGEVSAEEMDISIPTEDVTNELKVVKDEDSQFGRYALHDGTTEVPTDIPYNALTQPDKTIKHPKNNKPEIPETINDNEDW